MNLEFEIKETDNYIEIILNDSITSNNKKEFENILQKYNKIEDKKFIFNLQRIKIFSSLLLNSLVIFYQSISKTNKVYLLCLENKNLEVIKKSKLEHLFYIIKSIEEIYESDELYNFNLDNITGKILVVDDSPTIIEIIVTYLNGRGFTVKSASNGSEALEAVKNEEFDLILLDIMLPEMSGFDICKEIKKLNYYRNVPVIFLTALNDQLKKLEGFSVGAIDYVTKPFNYEELIARIKAMLFVKKLQDNLKYKNTKLTEAFAELSKLKLELENKNELLNKKNLELEQVNQALELAHTRIYHTNKKFYDQSIKDQLTELYNRRYLYSELEKIMSESSRNAKGLSCIIFDIDHFKKVNDNFGHQFGDTVLKTIADLMKSKFRKSDILCRFGGEEFIIILPECPLTDAANIAENFRKYIEEYEFKTENNKIIFITISLGISNLRNNDTQDLIIKRADDALYHAKNNGRNRIVTEEEIIKPVK